jgi:hypothetical protein
MDAICYSNYNWKLDMQTIIPYEVSPPQKEMTFILLPFHKCPVLFDLCYTIETDYFLNKDTPITTKFSCH